MSAPKPFHLSETPLVPGTNLIEASAGTGKTYAITALFLRLIVEQNLTVEQILVVTYTDAATEELRHRVREFLAKGLLAFTSLKTDVEFLQALVARYRGQAQEMAARLQNALWSFDQAPIYTIHAFCQRTLRDRAFESGILFDTELVTDPSELLQEVADDFWRKHFYNAGATLVGFALKNKLGPGSFLGLLKSCLNYPLLEFVSAADGQSLEKLSCALERAFQAAQECWLKDRKQIKSCFGSGQRWCNSPYNDDEWLGERFQGLDQACTDGHSSFAALNAFTSFCTAELEKRKAKRGAEGIPAQRFFGLCDELCAAEQIWLAGVQLAFLNYAKAELPRRKAERKIQHFDDLLTRLHEALAASGGDALATDLQNRYRAALIDEFQDTDPVQYQIFHRAFGAGQTFLFLIGDPKQAIYGFRGADIFTYLEAANRAGRQFTLGENWRSEARLVKAVNSIFGAGSKPFVFEDIKFKEAKPRGKADAEPLIMDGVRQPPFQFWFCPRGKGALTKAAAEDQLPGVVAAEIVRLLNGDTKIGSRKLRPEDIAVLVPENRQAELMQVALRAVNVPSVLHTTASLFESREAAELRRALAGIAFPADERLVKAALATELWGVDGNALSACEDSQWQQWLHRFHEYLERWQRHGFFRMFRSWLQAEQVRQRLLAYSDGERRLTNLLHLGEVLHQAEAERRLGISGLLKWFADQMSPGRQTPDEHQLRLERDDNAVRLITVHKSKGLEFPVVFCLFSWKSSEVSGKKEWQVLFHDPARDHRLVRDLGPAIDQAHVNLAGEERLAENVRLLYVALTRAKHRCYFAWGGISNAGTSAPAWLFHRPQPPGQPLLAALKEHFGPLPDEALRAQLDELSVRSDQAIAISNLPEASPERFVSEEDNSPRLKCREFKGQIQRDWVISSFSFFHAGRPEERPDWDALADNPSEHGHSSTIATAPAGMFAFPRGAKAGTCLHDILERVDLSAATESQARLVLERLQAHDLADPVNAEAVGDLLKRLTTLPLDPAQPGLQLGKIPRLQMRHELEFYFPVQSISSGALHQLLGKFGWSAARSPELGKLTFDPVRGFLKGYIDLVFRSENRYYLVDWKSNWLGNHVEDYGPAALREEMARQDYCLQYHLYTVALHKFLSMRCPGYDYDRDFGGVLYIFLRGVDPARPGWSVFRDRPQAGLVDQLATLLGGASS